MAADDTDCICECGFAETILIKHFNAVRAHQLSTLTLMLFCAIYIWLIFHRLKIENAGQALLIGFAWLLLTIGFEFALGRSTNKSWEYLFADYNILAGRIWPLFLVSLFLLPYLMYKLRH